MNRTRRWIHAALFTSLITAKVFAVEVNVNIKGCITDQKSKEPLIGATVQIVGSSIGAVTDMDGNFQLSGVENVFVRGLGDRYNLTTLNRYPIPSEDPEYKNIALDFFSTDVIQSVEVNKAFYGTPPADASGANINITSKELTGDATLDFSLSGHLRHRPGNGRRHQGAQRSYRTH